MSHIWVIEMSRGKGRGKWWVPWCYSESRYSRKVAREYMRSEKKIFPGFKFRLKKYVRVE